MPAGTQLPGCGDHAFFRENHLTHAFVAGATGYTGRAVVRVLVGRGLPVTAHIRPDSPRLADWRRRFEERGAAVDATPWEPAAMAETLQRLSPSVVFALLGTTQARGRSAARTGRAETYQTVDLELTLLLLRATAESAPQALFVYLSSVGASPHARSEYLRVRARVEEEVRRSGLRHLIARPSFITGPDRDEFRPGERIAAMLTDAGLRVAALFGARRLRERYRSTGPLELAENLVRHALSAGERSRLLESEALRE